MGEAIYAYVGRRCGTSAALVRKIINVFILAAPAFADIERKEREINETLAFAGLDLSMSDKEMSH